MSLLLAGKAEVVLAALLVSRHRSPRLAAFLTLAVAGAWAWHGASSGGAEIRLGASLLAAGMLASVNASRPLAPGGTLAAAWSTGAPWWLVPAGRLIGCLLVTVPVAAVAAVAMNAPGSASVRVVLIVLLYLSAVASLVLAVTPLAGATAAAGASLVSVWVGVLPPEVIGRALSGWPLVARVSTWLWHALPLAWRASRWVEHGGVVDLLVLMGWTLAGLLVAATAVRFSAWDRVAVWRQ